MQVSGKNLQRPLVVILLTLIMLFASYNRDEELVFVMACIMLSGTLLGLLLPHVSLRRIKAVFKQPKTAREGQCVDVNVSLYNNSWLPRYMLEAHILIPGLSDGEPLVQGFIPRFAARSRLVSTGTFVCQLRGLYRLGPLRLSTSFPLGLLTARREPETMESSILVYPSCFRIRELPRQDAIRAMNQAVGNITRQNGGSDFVGIREYRQGDSLRHIHWPLSARHGGLVVKELEQPAGLDIMLLMDAKRGNNIGGGAESTLEYMVKIAASLASYSMEHSVQVGMAAFGRTPLYIEPTCSSANFENIMRSLALFQPDSDTDYAHAIRFASTRCRFGTMVFLFFSTLDDSMRETAQAVAALKDKGAVPLCIIFADFGDTHQTFPEPNPLKSKTARGLLELGITLKVVRRGDRLEGIFP